MLGLIVGLFLLASICWVHVNPLPRQSGIVHMHMCRDRCWPFKLNMRMAFCGEDPETHECVQRKRARCLQWYDSFYVGGAGPYACDSVPNVERPNTQMAGFIKSRFIRGGATPQPPRDNVCGNPVISGEPTPGYSYLYPAVTFIARLNPYFQTNAPCGSFDKPPGPHQTDCCGCRTQCGGLGIRYAPFTCGFTADKAVMGPQGKFIQPPRWRAYMLTTDLGAAGENLPYPDNDFAARAMDYPHANEFAYMSLLPVEPIESNPLYNPDHPEWVPYHAEPNAPNEFCFEETGGTYEIPCYQRDYDPNYAPCLPPSPEAVSGTPWRNRAYGDNIPTVPAGLRGIIGFSSGDAKAGVIRNYCDGLAADPPECAVTKCRDAFDNVVRTYHGITLPRKHVWEDDPDERGWYVEYQAFVNGWFTQDGFWYRFDALAESTPRWAAWYEGKVRARIKGDVTVPGFRDFVLSLDGKFGVDFEPRYPTCNDALAGCAGQPKALGDTTWPSDATQAAANVDGVLPPCKRTGQSSQWYFWTGAPYGFGNPRPEGGLYHRITRKVYLDPQHQSFDTQHGWAKLVFTTATPLIIPA